MKLSLIIPCFNEEKNIAPLCKSLERSFGPKPYKTELIFINDGSSDCTLPELKSFAEKNSFPVTIIDFSRNFGKEAGIYAGLSRASGDLLCIMDADLQQSPRLAAEMTELLLKNSEYDCVTACRKYRNESRLNSFLKTGFYKILNAVSETDFVCGASDFRVFRSSVADAVLSLPEKSRFSKGLFPWVGFNTLYIDYEAEDRLFGKSKWPLLKLFKYAFSGIASFSRFPLQLASCSFFISSFACPLLLPRVLKSISCTPLLPGASENLSRRPLLSETAENPGCPPFLPETVENIGCPPLLHGAPENVGCRPFLPTAPKSFSCRKGAKQAAKASKALSGYASESPSCCKKERLSPSLLPFVLLCSELLFSVGIISLYFTQAVFELKKRPLFIVRETLKNEKAKESDKRISAGEKAGKNVNETAGKS